VRILRIRIIKLSCLASIDDLLSLAHDLADRLLPAFGGTATGVPFPRHVPASVDPNIVGPGTCSCIRNILGQNTNPDSWLFEAKPIKLF
jgi:hypothetical protein